MYYKEGERIVFNVSCRGNPNPDVFWFKNGILLKEDQKNNGYLIFKKTGDCYSLIIESCEFIRDVGFYSFCAKGLKTFCVSSCFIDISSKGNY